MPPWGGTVRKERFGMISFFLRNLSAFRQMPGGYVALNLLFMLVAYGVLILLILPVHEFAHAFVAYKCGDDTAKWQGRLTLRPSAHLSLWGTVLLVLCGFGFAKPVPVNTYRLRNPRRDMVLVALAGPASNLLMAVAAAALYKVCTLVLWSTLARSIAYLVLVEIVMSVNISLAVFNLLPVPPLDGSRLWSSLLPERWAYTLERYSNQITLMLFLLLFMGVLDAPLNLLNNLFYGAIAFLFGL